MNSQHFDGNDPVDPLERSLAALQNAPVPDGPSSQTTADTLAALRRVAGTDRIPLNPVGSIGLVQRILTMTYAHRKTAASLTIAIGAIALWSMLTLFSSVSYAQVAEKLKAVQSLTCTATINATGKEAPIRLKMMFLDPQHVRTEGPGDKISIVDKSASQLLVLDPTAKTAMLLKYETKGTPPPATGLDIVEEFRKIGDQKGEAIGEEQIGNVKAKGFRVTEGGRVMTIWADPKTSLPIRIDIAMEVANTKVQMTLSDVVLDARLDAGLFKLDVPNGYTLTNHELTLNLNIEENVAAVLKAYAAATDGQFPADLGDPALITKLVKVDANGKPDADFMKVASNVGALQGLLFPYEKGKTYGYIPGIKFGDDSRIVFWRQDKDSGKYFAVFGDLKTREVKAGEIPAAVKK
jgi:outer membrane lipoprotein-sorting protein